MDNDHEDSTFSTNKFNSSRLLVQACSSQSQTQKVQILQRKNSKNSAIMTKIVHMHHRTPISFLKGKINY